MSTFQLLLTCKEKEIIKNVWGSKIIKTLYSFKDGNEIHTCTIKFENGKKVTRTTATWRLEAKLKRKLKTFKSGGSEIVNHIDGDTTNDHPDNLQIMNSGDKLRDSLNDFDSNIIIKIMKMYYHKRIPITEISRKMNLKIPKIQNILNEKYCNYMNFKIPDNFKKPIRYSSKVSKDKILKILKMYYYQRIPLCDICKEVSDISKSNIQAIISRKSWKEIEFKIPENFQKPDNRIGFRRKNKNKRFIDDETIIAIRMKYYKFGISINNLCKDYTLYRYQVVNILNSFNPVFLFQYETISQSTHYFNLFYNEKQIYKAKILGEEMEFIKNDFIYDPYQ